MIVVGLAAGLVGAWALTVYLESLLFQVTAHDWQAYAAAPSSSPCVGVGSLAVPASRGARIDPIDALKYE